MVLAGISMSGSKRADFETWRIHVFFCGNNRWNELGNRILHKRNPFPKDNLHAVRGKSSLFQPFFGYFMSLAGRKDAFASRFAGGSHSRASVGELTLDCFLLPRNAISKDYLKIAVVHLLVPRGAYGKSVNRIVRSNTSIMTNASYCAR